MPKNLFLKPNRKGIPDLNKPRTRVIGVLLLIILLFIFLNFGIRYTVSGLNGTAVLTHFCKLGNCTKDHLISKPAGLVNYITLLNFLLFVIGAPSLFIYVLLGIIFPIQFRKLSNIFNPIFIGITILVSVSFLIYFLSTLPIDFLYYTNRLR